MSWTPQRSELAAILAVVVGLAAGACGSSSGSDLFDGSSSGGGSGSSGAGGSVAGGGAPAGGAGGGGEAVGGSSGGTAETGGAAGTGATSGTGGGAASGGMAGGGGCTPAEEVCDGLDNDCDGVADGEDVCDEDCHGIAIEDRGYMFCDAPSDLETALEACEDQGMRLVWIESSAENAALAAAIEPLASPDPGGVQGSGPDPGVRIGATDAGDEGTWRWIDGAEFWSGGQDGEPTGDAFASWSEDRPNNGGSSGPGSGSGEQCAVLLVRDGSDGNAGQWNDVRCDQDQPFVCESP